MKQQFGIVFCCVSALVHFENVLVGSEDLVDEIKPGQHERKIRVDNLDRRYLVHIPKNYNDKKKTPVVLVFHGGGSNPETMVRFSGMSKKSEEAGFIAVYPAGTGRTARILTFNGGNCCGYAMRNRIDDVEFTRKLLDDLESWANVDKRRIYATGMSNGAIVSYLMASKLSDRIAAIAPVAGPMGTESCHPKRPVPVMHFHGTDDENAPFQGGAGKRSVSGTNFKSVEHSIQCWVKANRCKVKPTVHRIADSKADGTTIEIKSYRGGRQGSEVVLVQINGAGHTWPGQQSIAKFLGKSTKNISANDMMWEFFRKHPMPNKK